MDTTRTEHDFLAQRERFLQNREIARQNAARVAKLQEELAQLYDHTLVTKTTARFLRAKLIHALNKYKFL